MGKKDVKERSSQRKESFVPIFHHYSLIDFFQRLNGGKEEKEEKVVVR